MDNIEKISDRFVEARQSASPIADYPGTLPASLDEAYAIQDRAISLWPDQVSGWKVGRITGDDAARFQTDRLLGPVFAGRTVQNPQGSVQGEIFAQGFAAVEGECVLVVAEDTPADKTTYTSDEARALIASAHIGIEIASSPFTAINGHGPLVTISDFGNNNGLIIGEALDLERADFQDWGFVTEIDGAEVGTGRSSAIPGGPLESFRYALEKNAQRGLPLKKGCAVTTGAITGIHEISVGQSAIIRAEGVAPLEVHITAFAP